MCTPTGERSPPLPLVEGLGPAQHFVAALSRCRTFIRFGLHRVKIAVAYQPVSDNTAKRVIAAYRVLSHKKLNGPFHIFFQVSH